MEVVSVSDLLDCISLFSQTVKSLKMEAVFVCWGVQGRDKSLLLTLSPGTQCLAKKTHPERLGRESVKGLMCTAEDMQVGHGYRAPPLRRRPLTFHPASAIAHSSTLQCLESSV